MTKKIFQKAKKMQQKLSSVEKELGALEVTGSAGGGAVVATMDGTQRLQKIVISPEVMNPEEAEILEDLVLIAVNEAIEKLQRFTSERLAQITGGLQGV
jgi:hypothetical protein